MDSIPPKVPGIYKIFFLDPNLFYIGSAVNLQNRRRQHLGDLRRGTHANAHMQNAYIKYGHDTFHFEIVEIVEQKIDLIEREQHYLDTLNPYYNIYTNAQSALGIKRTPETRARVSAAHIGQVAWNKGKPWTDEARAKLSASHKGQSPSNKGKPMPEAQRRAHSERMKGRIPGNKGKKGPPPPNKGVPMSEEQKRKVSEAKKGQVPWNKGLKSNKPAWNKGIKGNVPAMKGKHHSPEVKERMVTKMRATVAAKGGQPPPRKGAILSQETKDKIRTTLLNKSPEEKAQAAAKMRATKAANRAKKQTEGQTSLWDDEAAS